MGQSLRLCAPMVKGAFQGLEPEPVFGPPAEQ
jgi:hypothetical protein